MIVLKQKDVERGDANPDRVRSALAYLDPHDRLTWVEAAFAIREGLGDVGFDLWCEWGAAHQRPAPEVKATWKSAKPRAGGIGIGTLFFRAKEKGWKDDNKYEKPSADVIAKRKAAAAARAAQYEAEEAAEQAAAAERAQKLWYAAAPAETHPYLERKAVQAHGLRVGNWEYIDASTGEVYQIPDCLLIPMRDRSRKLWSLQCIEPDAKRDKRYLKGGAKRGNFFPIGAKPLEHEGRKVFVLGEGYATCASVHECTGHMVLVCFDASNLLAVAQSVRERAPDAIILFAADNDLWNRKPDGTPYNPGVEAATKAAAAVGGLVAIPPFIAEDAWGKDEKGNLTGPKDFNDWHGINGGQSLADVIDAALQGASLARVRQVVLVPSLDEAWGVAYALECLARLEGVPPSVFVVPYAGRGILQAVERIGVEHPDASSVVLAAPGDEAEAQAVGEQHGCRVELPPFGVGKWQGWGALYLDGLFDAIDGHVDAALRQQVEQALAQLAMQAPAVDAAVAPQEVQAGRLEQPAGGRHGRPPAAHKRTPGVAAASALGLAQAAADVGIASPQDASTPAARASSGVEREDGSGLIAEVGIIPLGSHGGDLVFWRSDFKRVVMLAPKALGSHQGLQCLAPTQKWEAWWRGGGKDFKPQFASNVLINWSAGLGDVDLSRVPATDAKPEEVREAFLRAKAAASGTSPAPVVLAELLALASEWRGVVFFDEFAARATYSVNPPCGGSAGPLTDGHDDMLAAYLGSKYGISVSSKAAHDTANLLASQNRRHPVREYLKSLEWDGAPRLDTWLVNYAGAKDDVFVRAASAKTLIAAVERAFVPGSKVDTALVLEGAQGVKKSTLLRALAPDTSWFAEDLAGTIGGKDALQGLHGKWMIELSEIAAIKKGTVEDVKAFLTRRVDSYRSPYGRRVADHPRQCVFVGSVNPSADGSWLHDTTGGRRFWPVLVTKADVAGLAQVRDQLWAEAVHRHQAGEQHWLTEKEEEIATKEQKARLQENPWDFAVAKFLESRAFNGEPIATAEIFEFSQNRKPASKDSRELTSIAEALRARGWSMKPHGPARTNRWFSGPPI